MERAIYDHLRDLDGEHWWFVARRRILGRLIQTLDLPAQPKILEVGCGAGGNIPLLKQFGDVQAVEPDAESRDCAAQRAGVPVHGGLLPDGLPFAPETFDLVCAFDVVEHVDDDRGALRGLAKLAKPGGWVLTTVPAYQWLWSRHDELHHHKRRYVLPEYRALVEGAGLTIEGATYFNTLLFPAAVAQRQVKRWRGDDSPDDAMPPKFLNRLLQSIFALEAPIVARGGLPFGMSIAVAARKDARS